MVQSILKELVSRFVFCYTNPFTDQFPINLHLQLLRTLYLHIEMIKNANANKCAGLLSTTLELLQNIV